MRQLMGILGWIENLRQFKKASNSNMLLDAIWYWLKCIVSKISHF